MFDIDKQRFGEFITALRKEKGLTQKDLAQRLYLSDKAVSKWERGLSLPDVTLLIPLSEALGVTVTELLRGERSPAPSPMEAAEVETLVKRALSFSEEECSPRGIDRKAQALPYLLCLLIAAAEITVLILLGCRVAYMGATVFLLEGMSAVFLAYFCFLVPQKLPRYYDENPISQFIDGPLRMNMPGVTFHNRNWPHIVRAVRKGLMTAMAAYPAAYLAVEKLLPGDASLVVNPILMGVFLFGFLFAPIYYQHRKHP